MKKQRTVFPHYHMCAECANKKGGFFPPDHVCTVTSGECPYCKTKDVTLIPWVDFDWKGDQRLNRIAKFGRD